MAQTVVDDLEAVEIDHAHGQSLMRMLDQRGAQFLHERPAVGQAGEIIAMGDGAIGLVLVADLLVVLHQLAAEALFEQLRGDAESQRFGERNPQQRLLRPAVGGNAPAARAQQESDQGHRRDQAVHEHDLATAKAQHFDGHDANQDQHGDERNLRLPDGKAQLHAHVEQQKDVGGVGFGANRFVAQALYPEIQPDVAQRPGQKVGPGHKSGQQPDQPVAQNREGARSVSDQIQRQQGPLRTPRSVGRVGLIHRCENGLQGAAVWGESPGVSGSRVGGQRNCRSLGIDLERHCKLRAII